MTRDELKALLDNREVTDGMVAIRAVRCPMCGAREDHPCRADAEWGGRVLWNGRRAHPARMDKLFTMIARLDLLT